MSTYDLDGTTAFDNVMDRLVNLVEEKERTKQTADTSHYKISELERELQRVKEDRDGWRRVAEAKDDKIPF